MLPASWALLRSSRAHLLRAGLNRRHTHTLLFSGAQNGAVLAFRQAHSGVEPESSPQNDFPIDVVNSQTTLRVLTTLIEEGKQVEAGQLLTEFLKSSAIDGRLDAFRRLRAVLGKAPQENLPLILQLGSGYASMGYTELVKEQILPIVRQYAPKELWSHFELDIQLSSSTASPSIEEVEEVSSMIFEDEGEEYLLYQPVQPLAKHSTIQSTGVLEKLTKDGNYGLAYDLLKEMQELGVEIPPSNLYEAAANKTLVDPQMSLKEKLERFSDWFSLVPPAHLVPANYDFKETRRHILQSQIFYISLLMRFALILARKGYADSMSDQVVPQIIRSSSKEIGAAFLEDFNKAHLEYLLEFNIRNPIFKMKKTATNVQGIAIRALAYSGRVEEAISLLPHPEFPAFKLTTYTYNVVLRRLKVSPTEIRDKHIEYVKRLRDQDLTAIPLPRSNLDTLRALSQEHELTAGGHTADPVDFGENLVSTLRYLKTHINAPINTQLPHPFTLVNFMSMYLATGRTQALKMLLDKAIRGGFTATSNFVFAEMLFYRRLKQPNLVIQTFMDHFFLSGVPREEVIRRYNRFDGQRNLFDPSSGEDPPLRRFYPFNSSTTLPRGKIWPNRIHCNLVWDALAELTTQTKDLEPLYYKLIQYAQEGRDSPESSILSIGDEVPVSSSWNTAIGTAAFTPFVYRMMYARGPDFGVRMLRDMLQLGIKPTAYHYTELAGFYARKNDVRKVFIVLDGMERGEAQPFGEDTYTSPPRGVAEPVRHYSLPAPTLVTYTSLLRGFLIAMNRQAAEEVYKRLMKVHDYVPGQYSHLDAAVKDLEEFKRQGNNWVYPYFADVIPEA